MIFLGTSRLWLVAFRCLYIFGLYGMFKKCGVKPWKAFIPFVRNYELAVCADHEMEGRVVLVVNFLDMVMTLIGDGIGIHYPKAVVLLVASFALALTVIDLIYTIRISAGLCEIFQRRKRWIFMWFIFSGVAAAIWGWSKKFQPSIKVENMREDALKIVRGTTEQTAIGEGLSVNITERTVMEFFQKKYLLRDISMNIKPGHMVLLLGGSGAGKTTFLNAVNGYEKAKAKVLLNGKDIYSDYKKMQYQIGFVPQQNLMRGKDTIIHTVNDAALMRLPTNVPPQDRSVMARELMTQLRKIADQGKIVIVITHTPDRVIDLFDDVIVLAKDSHRTGRLAFFGSIDEARAFFGCDSMEKIVMSINAKDAGGEGRADEFVRKYAEQRAEVSNG